MEKGLFHIDNKRIRNKKLWFFTWMMVMVVSLSGCSDSGKEEPDIEELVYGYEQLVYDNKLLSCMNEIKGEISEYAIVEDSVYIFTSQYQEPEKGESDIVMQYLYKCESDGTNFMQIPYEPVTGSGEWLHDMSVSPQREIYLLFANYVSEQTTYILRIVGEDGRLISETELGAEIEGGISYVQNMKIDKNGNIYLLFDQFIYIFDRNGKKIGQIEEEFMVTMVVSPKGTILVGLDVESGYKIKEIDLEELMFTQTYETNISYADMTSISDGEEYSFYYNDGDSLYGYDLESAQSTELISWIRSDINAGEIGAIEALREGRFMISYYEEELSDAMGLYLLTQKDPKEVKHKEIVTYWSLYPDMEIKEKAIRFNKSQDRYLVMVKDYGESENSLEAMHKDLMAGKVTDMVDLSGLCSEKYVAKGMFADLYELMKNDEVVKKEHFVSNFLKTMETDGKLYHISPTVGINVMAARKSDVEEGKPLTMEALTELEETNSQQARAFYMNSKQSVLTTLFETDYESFVDWSKGECRFESEEFIALLEYANTYLSEEDILWDENTESFSSKLKKGDVLFAPMYSMGAGDVQLYETMFDGDLTFIGFPSNKYAGGALSMEREFAIMNSSLNKEGAWEFLKSFLSSEYLSEYMDQEGIGFPILKDSMESKMKRVSATEPYTDENGNEVFPLDSLWGYDEVEVTLTPLNKGQMEILENVIEQIDHRYIYDYEMEEIILQEANAYFEGQIPAKTAAQLIQERISTYMEEYR